MSEKPAAPAALVQNVRKIILYISPRDPDPLKDSHNLRWDLGMAEYQRKSLQVPFNREAQSYDPEAFMTVAACAGLTTVGSAIRLVAGAAGFTYKREE